jgi:glycerol uptake facilitator-like aquaporin
MAMSVRLCVSSTSNSDSNEIKESAGVSLDHLEAQPSSEVEEDVPLEDQWSWNPVDWYRGVLRELSHCNLQMTEKKRGLIRAVLGEGLVTFIFMFVVMATRVNNARQEIPENLVLRCISTTFVSIALIYSFEDVSGAHFNSAVTFGVMIAGRMAVIKGILFIGVQLIATIIATLAVMVVFPGINGNDQFGIANYVVVEASPDSTILNIFFMELLLSFVLVYVVFATAFDNGIWF